MASTSIRRVSSMLGRRLGNRRSSPDTNTSSAPDSRWVFGYGSLIWKPGFNYVQRRTAYLPGYQRRFWQGSHVARGSVEQPGRVATLAKTNKDGTWGTAYEVRKEDYPQVMEYLYRREKGYSLYEEELTFECQPGGCSPSTATSLVFVAEDTGLNPEYLGPASMEEMAEDIALAHGTCGPSADYLFNLAKSMRRIAPKCEDDHLFQLEQAVKNRLAKDEEETSKMFFLSLVKKLPFWDSGMTCLPSLP